MMSLYTRHLGKLVAYVSRLERLHRFCQFLLELSAKVRAFMAQGRLTLYILVNIKLVKPMAMACAM